MEKDIQKVLARQTAARAALAGLPDDAPEAIKKRVVEDVEQAEAAVWDTNKWLSKRGRKFLTPGNIVSFLLGSSLVVSFVMFLGQEPGPDVRAGESSYSGRVPSVASRPRLPRTAHRSRIFRVSASDRSLFTAAAAENIACQQAGYAGTILEDIKCFPSASATFLDADGSCAQADITMSCTMSQAKRQENINTMREFAAKLR